MKVERKALKANFTPYQLTLTIESEDEQEFLRAVMNNRDALLQLVNNYSNYGLDAHFKDVPNHLDTDLFDALTTDSLP